MDGIVAVLVITDGIMNTFRKNNALSPDRARTKTELHIRSKRIFNNLVSKGVIKRESGDRYYMDVQAQERYLRRRRIILIVGTASAVTIALIFALLWR
jgi:hypothetical protein